MIEGPDFDFGGDTSSVERIDLFSLRLIVYAPNAADRRWISEELAGLMVVPHFVDTLGAAFEALANEPRRRVILIDYESLSKDDRIELRALRQWVSTGTFIALGNVREHLRAPLRITHVLPRPLGSETLRGIIDDLDRQRDTIKLS